MHCAGMNYNSLHKVVLTPNQLQVDASVQARKRCKDLLRPLEDVRGCFFSISELVGKVGVVNHLDVDAQRFVCLSVCVC